jgi:circadian clock protein KaiC
MKNNDSLAPVSSKIPTGISGLDAVLKGGLPRERISLIIGGPGSGKTIMALQTLVNGAVHYKEPGIFVAFEENTNQIIANAAVFGWDLVALQRRKLFFLDARMGPELVKSGDFDLSAMLAIISEKARKMGAVRVVFDAIDVLLSLLDDPAAERRELYRVYHWLQQSGLTGIVTAKAEHAEASGGKLFTNMQFMSDAVILLTHELSQQVSLRKLWIMKYRGSGFSENEAALTIGSKGIEILSNTRTEWLAPVTMKRISSGVSRLDTMLGGGYFRGSSVLVTGSPGTSKSTLAASFAEAACKRGEKVLYVSFDENADELSRNLSSVGIKFAPKIKSGRLVVYSVLAESCSAKEHFNAIASLIDEHEPACLVIDPLSALIKSGGDALAQSTVERLINFGKARGVTVFNTSLPLSNDQKIEASPLQISTIADTWIHLSYVVLSGERNRALTIVKSRGMKHSNQVRELVLSEDGVTMADAYTADGEVLMGTMRWQKEQEETLERTRQEAEAEHRRVEFEWKNEEMSSRLKLLEREIHLRKAEADLSAKGEQARKRLMAVNSTAMLRKRSADNNPAKRGRV